MNVAQLGWSVQLITRALTQPNVSTSLTFFLPFVIVFYSQAGKQLLFKKFHYRQNKRKGCLTGVVETRLEKRLTPLFLR